MEVERFSSGVGGAPVAEAFSLMVQTAVVADKSVRWLLFQIGLIHNNADALSDLLEAEKRFPFNDLNKVSSPDAKCKDNGENEDDSDDDEDADAGDESDNDAEDSSGEDDDDDDDDEQGGADSDSDDSDDEDDDDEDDDDDDDEDEDDDDDDDEDEEEENQPPFKKKRQEEIIQFRKMECTLLEESRAQEKELYRLKAEKMEYDKAKKDERLRLKAEKLRIEAEKMKLAKKELDQRIMMMDVNVLPEMQRQYFQEHQREIMMKRNHA